MCHKDGLFMYDVWVMHPGRSILMVKSHYSRCGTRKR